MPILWAGSRFMKPVILITNRESEISQRDIHLASGFMALDDEVVIQLDHKNSSGINV